MTDTARFEREFTLTRTLDAPRELVFQAWTDADELYWFFSPVKPPTRPIELDLRVGGTWRLQMIVAEDTEYMTGGIYLEIEPSSRLVFRWGAVGGWPNIDPENPNDGPVVTITFEPIGDGGRTEMQLTVALPDQFTDERVREWMASGMREGWGDTIDRVVEKFADPR